MSRKTSSITYRAIVDEGLLSPLRLEIYTMLFIHGPMTCKEVTKRIGAERDSISPRMQEMVRMGVVEETGERMCSVSDRLAVLWDVTDQLPRKDTGAIGKTRAAKGGDQAAMAALREALAPFARMYEPRNAAPLHSLMVNAADLRRAHELIGGANG